MYSVVLCYEENMEARYLKQMERKHNIKVKTVKKTKDKQETT